MVTNVEDKSKSKDSSLKSLEKDDSICLNMNLKISTDLSPIRKNKQVVIDKGEVNLLVPVLMEDSDSELLEQT